MPKALLIFRRETSGVLVSDTIRYLGDRHLAMGKKFAGFFHPQEMDMSKHRTVEQLLVAFF